VRKRSAMLQGRPRDVFLPRTFHQIFRGFVHDMSAGNTFWRCINLHCGPRSFTN
jgi:hypothetical protein